MKNLKKGAAGAALVAMMATNAMAQEMPQMPRRPPSTPEYQRLLMSQRQIAMKGYRDQLQAQRKKRLKAAGVSDAQITRMEAVEKKYEPQMRRLQRQMQALMMKAQREQMAILTLAQRQKLMKGNMPTTQR